MIFAQMERTEIHVTDFRFAPSDITAPNPLKWTDQFMIGRALQTSVNQRIMNRPAVCATHTGRIVPRGLKSSGLYQSPHPAEPGHKHLR